MWIIWMLCSRVPRDRPDVPAVDGEQVADPLFAQNAGDERAAVDVRVALLRGLRERFAHPARAVHDGGL
jgi:hypothetical protein